MVAAAQTPPTGAENVLWDLSVFYTGTDDPAIERDLSRITDMAEGVMERYRGRVARLSGTEMAEAYRQMEAIYDLMGRLDAFASLQHSTDMTNPQYGALVQKIDEHSAQVRQKLLFFDLEWKAADDIHIRQVLDDPAMANYRYAAESELRYKPYMLTEAEEQLLVDKSVTGRNAWTRFFEQLTSSMRFEWRGEQVNLSNVLKYLFEADREVRVEAAASVTAGLQARLMELTYIFNVTVADKASDDKRRGYPSWVSARNLANKAPDAVVNALVQAVTDNYDIVAKHYRLKRILLGLDELTDYDRYAPLPIEAAERDYSWEEARATVVGAYSNFSQELGDIAQRFFSDNWIHAPVWPNKRSGAFANPSVPSAHPFVFVNYLGKNRDVMTLAHELGHGAHMVLSGGQTLANYYTPLTTAEMASTFGEMLVFTDLQSKEPDKATRLANLAGKIEDSFATIFRQVAMNRFEDALHTARRGEGELSTERISELWLETQRAMFGDSVTLREDYGAWWSYIGHFIFAPGYVYAYAFGELLVLALFNLYQKRGAEFAPQYLDVLRAGDSDYPEKILAKVGVDLSDPNFWSEGLAALRALVDEEEALAKEVYPEKF